MHLSTTFLLCAFILVTLVGATYLVSLRRRKVDLATIPDVLRLLDPKNVPLTDLLHMRSIPSTRLRHAFNLTNTFVTDDPSVHKSFVKSAKALIPSTPAKWAQVAQYASFIVEQSLTVPPYSPHEVPYDIYIQRVTFKVVVASLFGVGPDEMADLDVDIVAKGINHLWQQSKVSTCGDPVLLSSINSRLNNWLPNIDNPLDFVIPTFETMWRVMAVTVALVLRDEHARRALSQYLCNPSHGQFKHWPDDSSGPSIDALIRESLRLHPPTRHISRTLPIFPSISPYLPAFLQTYFNRIVVANVGTVHRNPHIWGPDVGVFDAMRHHPSTTKELSYEQIRSREKGMLAFGAGPLKCVAFNWAPQFVGIVVAAVLENEGSLLKIVEGQKIGGREGWDDWKVLIEKVPHANSELDLN